jgi:hypothetical protein
MAAEDSKSVFDDFVRAQQKSAQPDVDWNPTGNQIGIDEVNEPGDAR